MNYIDKAIEYLAPGWAAKREAVRLYIDQLRGYNGASKGRRTSGWKTSATSVNTENEGALSTLRDRSRDLVRNNSYAKRAIKVISNNVVGSGIRLSITGSGSDKLKVAWREWAESTDCDYTGKLTFYGLQRLIMKGVAESGEMLVRIRRVPSTVNKYGVQLELLEGDYIDHQRSENSLHNGGYILQGVEFDKNGKVVAYWMFDRHPGDIIILRDLASKRIPADNILHIYEVLRAGQVRGVPMGESSMLTLNDFGDYKDAQLIRQKIAACFAIFIKNAGDPITGTTKSGKPLPEKVEPGMIEKLGAGEEVTFGSPPAADGYDEYSKNVLREVAAGYGTTYEQMTGDLSNVNFSSYKAGWIEAHKMYRALQDDVVIPQFCDKVFKYFLFNADLLGIYKGAAKAKWTTPRRDMIDPLKEMKALVEEVRAGFKPWQEAVRELGYEPDEIIVQLKEDAARFDKLEIKPYCDPRFDTNRVEANAEVNDDDDKSE